MSYSSIQQELINMQSNTAVNQAKERQQNGASQELDGDAFLTLMLEQLKNQDPMDPMDNSEMLAQQAQFTQLTELQELNDTINQNNIIQQANSLVGKTVQIVDPNNTSRLITGLVTSAKFTNGSATITVNGKEIDVKLKDDITKVEISKYLVCGENKISYVILDEDVDYSKKVKVFTEVKEAECE